MNDQDIQQTITQAEKDLADMKQGNAAFAQTVADATQKASAHTPVDATDSIDQEIVMLEADIGKKLDEVIEEEMKDTNQ